MAALPAVFVSHGAPTLALEPGPTRDALRNLGAALPRPRAILAVSAHWETDRPATSLARLPETVHDFHGFPQELYRMRYAAPGAPELAQRAIRLIDEAGIPAQTADDRGLDHGAWVPLGLMYPAGEIPVTQLSVQPRLGPAHHLRLGEALRPLRGEGVLILASGSVTHNLGEFGRHRYDSPPPAWVSEFNEWLAGTIEQGRTGDLVAYRRLAPHAARNHPSEEHLLPLFVAAGAGGADGARRVHSAYTYGVIGMDAWRFG